MRRRRTARVLGLRSSRRLKPRVNDPFDYEQKYGEDEEFQEMGPMARIWKMFLDESIKFDTEMVEDWRDGLDVLLVFAGLFSAVVSTFVAQAAQNLQKDHSEVTASLVFELVSMGRAFLGGDSIDEVPRSTLTPTSAFSPTATYTWVNALWFTSLALSLTTALLAVLTKQWIHQYMSVPSGTPRDRCRVRHFRFLSLKTWQVPVIIGLLPVLMHISLGVFFSGLIIYLISLSTSMACVTGGIVFVAFVAYVGSNLLPIFRHDCPYKTPLTLYLYPIFSYLRQCIRQPPSSKPTPYDNEETVSQYNLFTTYSLKVIEQERVKREADVIDARALSWLFKMSSNLSVQRIIVQAISNLPLQSLRLVRKKIPMLRDVIASFSYECIRSHQQSAFARYYRARLRLGGTLFTGRPREQYSRLLDPHTIEPAVQLLRGCILGDEDVTFDVITWASIFEHALKDGAACLDVNVEGSQVWVAFLDWAVQPHNCLAMNCDNHMEELISKELRLPPYYDPIRLSILDMPKTSSPMRLFEVLKSHMYPSVCDLLLKVAFPSFYDDPVLKGMPSDITLHLALIQDPIVQKTSLPPDEDADKSLMTKVLRVIDRYLYPDPGSGLQHPRLLQAIFIALRAVVDSEAFGNGDALSIDDETAVLDTLFKVLVRDKSIIMQNLDWLGQGTVQKIYCIIFGYPILPVMFARMAANIIHVATMTCGRDSGLGVMMYKELTQRRWLDAVGINPLAPELVTAQGISSRAFAYPGDSMLASVYVYGLDVLERTSDSVFKTTISYLEEPQTLLKICKVMILADYERQCTLWSLARRVTIRPSHLQELQVFLSSIDAKMIYESRAAWNTQCRDSEPMQYCPFSQLRELLTHLASNIRDSSFSPPSRAGFEIPRRPLDFPANDQHYRKSLFKRIFRHWNLQGDDASVKRGAEAADPTLNFLTVPPPWEL